jgi:hypothetical protein
MLRSFRQLRFRLLAAVTMLAGAGGACLAQTAGGQGSEIANAWAPTTVSHYAGVTAWSALDPRTGEYTLMVHDGGDTRSVGVAPRPVPFDVDLGPDERGDPVAAYSRCEREPRLSQRSRPGLPIAVTGRGCDVFVISLADAASAVETKVRGASTDGASEFLPSVWRGKVAFGRVYEQREGRRGTLPYLYVRSLHDEATSQRLPGGPRGQTGRPGPRALDLYGRRLGIVWEHVRQAGDLRTAIRLDTRGGRPRLVGRVDSTAETTYSHVGVDLVHGRLFWGTDCVGQTCAGGEQGASFVSRVRIEGLEQEGIAYLSGTDRLAASAQARSSGVSVRAEGFSLQSGGGARCRDLDDPALAREPGCRIVVEELSFGAPRP